MKRQIPPRGLRDLLWIGKQSLLAEEFYYARVKWRYRCLEMSWWILVQIDWTKTEGRTSENWEGNKEMCWHVAQLLDGKTSHRDANTVPYFSPIRLRGVGTFAERQKRGQNTRTRESRGSLEISSRHVAFESRVYARVSPCEPCACEVSQWRNKWRHCNT